MKSFLLRRNQKSFSCSPLGVSFKGSQGQAEEESLIAKQQEHFMRKFNLSAVVTPCDSQTEEHGILCDSGQIRTAR